MDSLLEGNKIIGCEPINYPATDGVIIYLEDSAGKIRVLTIETTEEDPTKYIGVTIAKL